MSNTPETDALRKSIDNGANAEAEMTSFARKLERDRDEAREAIRALAEHGESEIQRITKECDEAREERDKLKQLLAADSERVDAYLGVCMERDDAREEINRYREKNDLLPISWDV